MSLFHAALQPAMDENGDPISGAVWQFTRTNTTTPISVYSNAALTTSLGSTVESNAAGRFPTIFLNDAILYRARLWPDDTLTGTPIKEIDPANGETAFFATPQAYGAVGDGVTDDTAAIQAAIDDNRTVYFPPVDVGYLVGDLTVSLENQCLHGDGEASCLIYKVGIEGTLLDSNGNGITIRGMRFYGQHDSSQAGNASPVQARNGLKIDFDMNTTLDGVTVHGFRDTGIQPSNAGGNRGGATSLHDVMTYNCWMGMNLGNTVAEYIRLTNITANGCRYGLRISSGNITGAAGTINDNYINLHLYGTDADVPNDGHGNLTGFLFNHATGYTVYAEDITYGFNLDGNQFWTGNIYLKNCRGISICHSEISVAGLQFEGGGRNYVCHNRLYTSVTDANAITHSYNGSADDTLAYDNVQIRDQANPTGAPLVTQSTTRQIIGRSNSSNADHVFLHMGESGLAETYGLSWSSNGSTGVFKLRALNNNVLTTNATITIDRTTGKVTGMYANLSNYADDAAASAGGIPVGGLYRNGSVVMQRVA
jgi:hypothetical protein